MEFQMHAKAVALGIVTWPPPRPSQTQTPVEIDQRPRRVRQVPRQCYRAPAEDCRTKAILAKVYNEKLEQASSFHYEKGVTCISCHDQKQGGPAWMVPATILR